jgi:hypothetical protein
MTPLLTPPLFWSGGLLERGKAQGGVLLGRGMFQAFGVHGPELTPLAHAVLNAILVLSAFFLLMAGQHKNRFALAALATLVLGMAALRVVFQPLPNVQPVTLAALLVGSQLGASGDVVVEPPHRRWLVDALPRLRLGRRRPAGVKVRFRGTRHTEHAAVVRRFRGCSLCLWSDFYAFARRCHNHLGRLCPNGARGSSV